MIVSGAFTAGWAIDSAVAPGSGTVATKAANKVAGFVRIALLPWLVVVAIAIILAGCASTMTPEQKLGRGYDSADASVRTTTALVNRDAISTTAARVVSETAKSYKTVLDDGARQLAACRAKEPAQDCKDAVSTINLGFGVLMNVEQYLEEHQQ
jgi:hypothetical protein